MIQSIKMAWKSITGNKLRAILTMLGIIIGVMALVILVSLVNGATSGVTDQINSLGSNTLTVTISDDKNHPVTLTQLNEWMQEEEVGDLAPVSSESMTGKYDSNNGSVTVYGTTPSYFDAQEMSVYLGRFLKNADVENHLNVCVLNQNAASDLVGYVDCIGKEISLNGMKFTIVGVAADDESLTNVFNSSSLAVYIPYTSLIRLSTTVSNEITTFYASAPEGGTMESAEDKLNEILLERFEEDEDAFSISSQDTLESAMSSITSILTILLGGIAAISLIVGGIGIMNIMLVTVTERTREIGIRKAIGASRGAILTQFLIEAIMLCMMGCLCGIGLSWAVLQAITIVVSDLEMEFAMNGTVVMIAVAFCFAIGVIFGLYPANKAAKMKPIDALHYGG